MARAEIDFDNRRKRRATRKLREELAQINENFEELFDSLIGDGGAVSSVNGQTGVVLLDPDTASFADTTTTNKWFSQTERDKLAAVPLIEDSGSAIVSVLNTEIGSDVWQSGGSAAVSFFTRAAFVSGLAGLSALEDGDVVYAAGLGYFKSTGATDISDLPDFLPCFPITTAHFGAKYDVTVSGTTISGTDDAAAINAALAYAGSIREATRFANKKGSGAEVWQLGPSRIDSGIEIRKHGVSFVGVNNSRSALVPTFTTGTVLYIGGTDPFNEVNSTDNKIGNVFVSRLGLWGPGGTSNTRSGIVIDRGLAHLSELDIQNQYRSVEFRASEKGCRLTNSYITYGDSGGYPAGSTGIKITRREVHSSDAQGRLDSTDGLYYDFCTSIYLDNLQMNNVTGFGWEVVVDVDTTDGLYASNCHFGMGKDAIVRFKGSQSNLPILNVQFANCFADDDGGVNTAFSYLFDSGSLNNIKDVQIYGGEMNGGSTAAVKVDNALVEGLIISNCPITNGQLHGVWVNAGSHIKVVGCGIKNNNLSAGVGNGINITGGSDIQIESCDIYGSAYRGVSMTGGTNVRLRGLEISDTSSLAIYSELAATAYTVTNCKSDKTKNVASAATTSIPLEHRGAILTGGTTVVNIDDVTTGGTSSFDERELVLGFATNTTVTHGTGNIILKAGSDFAGTTTNALRLAYIASVSKWVEV